MPRRTSKSWLHFSVVSEEQQIAKCNICSTKLSFAGGNVGNLNRHLKTKHPFTPSPNDPNVETVTLSVNDISNDFDESGPSSHLPPPRGTKRNSDGDAIAVNANTETEQQQQSSNADIRQYTVSKKPLSIMAVKKLHSQLLRTIVSEYFPFKMVEGKEFRKFVYMLNSKYELPSRKFLSNSMLLEQYNICLERVAERINKSEAIALTTDTWTSINNESFIAVTAHYINDNEALEHILLDCCQFDSRHTADNIASFLKEMAKKFKIENKITAVVTDNAANMLAAVKSCAWRHVSCFAHTLNLVVQDTLQDEKIQETIKKVKNHVEFFRRSSHAAAKLRSTADNMKLPETKLKQDIVTRWNSTLDMIRRFLTLKDAVISTCAVIKAESRDTSKNNLISDTFSSIDIHILEELVSVLTIFEDVTLEISAENYVTSSKILVLGKLISNKLIRQINTNVFSPEVEKVVKTLQTEFTKRFQKYKENDILLQATVLDPRFKKLGVDDNKKYESTVAAIKKKVTDLIRRDNENAMEVNLPTINENESSNLWEEFDADAKLLSATAEPTAAGHIEVDKYANEPLLARKKDPFKYWLDRKHTYPGLYQLTKRRLCIPGSSVPCERVFSKAGYVLTAKRNRLKSTKVQQILFLKYNAQLVE